MPRGSQCIIKKQGEFKMLGIISRIRWFLYSKYIHKVVKYVMYFRRPVYNIGGVIRYLLL